MFGIHHPREYGKIQAIKFSNQTSKCVKNVPRLLLAQCVTRSDIELLTLGWNEGMQDMSATHNYRWVDTVLG
jgi:hypothetical protein